MAPKLWLGLSYDKISQSIGVSKPALLKWGKTHTTEQIDKLTIVARTGAFSNQFIHGMKQLYELEPLIKVKSSL